MDNKPRAFGKTPEIEPETDKDGMEIPSEQEQMDYDMVVSRAIKLIHGEKSDDVVKMLGASESPAQGIGELTGQLIYQINKSAKAAKKDIDDNTLMHAGIEIIEELSELAVNRGIFKYEDKAEESKELQDAALYATQAYGQLQTDSNEITPEIKQRADRDMTEGLAKEQAATQPSPEEKKSPHNTGIISEMMDTGGITLPLA